MNPKILRIIGLVAIGVSAGVKAVVAQIEHEQFRIDQSPQPPSGRQW